MNVSSNKANASFIKICYRATLRAFSIYRCARKHRRGGDEMLADNTAFMQIRIGE